MSNPIPTHKQKHILRALLAGNDMRVNQHGLRVLNQRVVPDAVIDVMIADWLLRPDMKATTYGRKAVQP